MIMMSVTVNDIQVRREQNSTMKMECHVCFSNNHFYSISCYRKISLNVSK